MEHQDTKMTSMRPRLKELNDNPYLRVQGTFSIQVVVYLDSEEEIMDDKCIDGEYDMVLDYDNDKWSVVDLYKMKLDLPQI